MDPSPLPPTPPHRRRQVWHARWLGADVAVKIMVLKGRPTPLKVHLLNGVEANYLRKITHPNIVQTYHVYKVWSRPGTRHTRFMPLPPPHPLLPWSTSSPYIHPSLRLLLHPSAHPSLPRSLPLCLRPSIHPCIHPSVRPSIHPSMHHAVAVSIHPSTHPCVRPSIRPDARLSVPSPIANALAFFPLTGRSRTVSFRTRTRCWSSGRRGSTFPTSQKYGWSRWGSPSSPPPPLHSVSHHATQLDRVASSPFWRALQVVLPPSLLPSPGPCLPPR